MRDEKGKGRARDVPEDVFEDLSQEIAKEKFNDLFKHFEKKMESMTPERKEGFIEKLYNITESEKPVTVAEIEKIVNQQCDDFSKTIINQNTENTKKFLAAQLSQQKIYTMDEAQIVLEDHKNIMQQAVAQGAEEKYTVRQLAQRLIASHHATQDPKLLELGELYKMLGEKYGVDKEVLLSIQLLIEGIDVEAHVPLKYIYNFEDHEYNKLATDELDLYESMLKNQPDDYKEFLFLMALAHNNKGTQKEKKIKDQLVSLHIERIKQQKNEEMQNTQQELQEESRRYWYAKILAGIQALAGVGLTIWGTYGQVNSGSSPAQNMTSA
jgi:hypothetical protein